MTDMADRLERHDRRSRVITFSFAFAMIVFAVLMPVVGTLGPGGFELWMISQSLMGLGFAINIVLRELGRPRAGIVVGYGLVTIAMLNNVAHAAVGLAGEPPRFPGVAINTLALLISAALLVYVLTFARRSYRNTQSPPAH